MPRYARAPPTIFELEVDESIVLSVKVRRSQLKRIDRVARALGFQSRSSFIRHLLLSIADAFPRNEDKRIAIVHLFDPSPSELREVALNIARTGRKPLIFVHGCRLPPQVREEVERFGAVIYEDLAV